MAIDTILSIGQVGQWLYKGPRLLPLDIIPSLFPVSFCRRGSHRIKSPAGWGKEYGPHLHSESLFLATSLLLLWRSVETQSKIATEALSGYAMAI